MQAPISTGFAVTKPLTSFATLPGKGPAMQNGSAFQQQSSEEHDQEIFFRLIDEAVSKLPPQQQKAWILSRREGLMYEEVATQMQLSRETVKRHIQLSVRFITNYVKQHAELHTSAIVLYTLL